MSTKIVGTKIVDLVETPGMLGKITEQGEQNRSLIKVEWRDGSVSIEDLADEYTLWIRAGDYEGKIIDQGL